MSQLVFDKVVLHYYKRLGALLLLAGCTVISHAATYKIEPDQSNVRFAIDHLKTSATTGGFFGEGAFFDLQGPGRCLGAAIRLG